MRHEPINVREFGAKGDGVADDTAAINAAFDEMRQNSIVLEVPINWGGAEWMPGTCPSLVFPCGHYRISDEINISGNFEALDKRDMGAQAIRGDNAIIEQVNPDKDIFASAYSVLTHVTGFKFLNGRNQLWLNNPNVGAYVKVTHCEFHGASGVAVIFGYSCPSTLAYLAGCLFMNCEQWIHTMTDVSTFRDVHGGSNPGMSDKAVMDIRSGIVTMDNIMATPFCDGRDQRWIDNRASALKLSNCRFGGEFGGFLPVLNFAKYDGRASYASSILIDNCLLPNMGNMKRPAVVYCEEIPNRIMVRNSTIVGIPAIMVDDRIDLDNYFVDVDPCLLDFAAEHCTGQLVDIPERLEMPRTVQTNAGFLGDEETGKRLDEVVGKAAEYNRTYKAPAPATSHGHREQTDSGKYMEIDPDTYDWSLDCPADAERTLNSKYYALAAVDDDILIMKRNKQVCGAYVLVKNVTIDLDRYPYLTYRHKLTESGKNMLGALRIVNKADGGGAYWNGGWGPDAPLYDAFNLREYFGGGTKTFDIRVYPGANRFYVNSLPPEGESDIDKYHIPTESEESYIVGDTVIIRLEAGEYIHLDFLRAEAE